MTNVSRKVGRPRKDNDPLILLALCFIYGSYYQVEKRLGWTSKRVRNRIKRMLEEHGDSRADLLELNDAIERPEKPFSSIFEQFYTSGQMGNRYSENSRAGITAMIILHGAEAHTEDKEILRLAFQAKNELLALSGSSIEKRIEILEREKGFILKELETGITINEQRIEHLKSELPENSDSERELKQFVIEQIEALESTPIDNESDNKLLQQIESELEKLKKAHNPSCK